MTPPPPRSTLFPYTTLLPIYYQSSTELKPIIVSQAFARKLFGKHSPLGRRIVEGTAGTDQWQVIGVVGDTKYRSEEHTSELQSHVNLVCRLLLEKKKSQK